MVRIKIEVTGDSLVILRSKMMFRRDDLDKLRRELIDQAKDGVILLPDYVSLEAVIRKDMEE